MDYKLILKIVGATIFIVVIVLVFSLVELYTQVGRYQRYWTHHNQQAAKPNELLYVALGDSTAQGIGAGAATKGYVGDIAKELQKRNSSVPVRTVNLSKSGAKIDDALDRQMTELNKLPIDDKTVLTMEIGANDMISFDAVKFESQMDQLMGKLPKQTIISDIPYFGHSRFKNNEQYVVQANVIMYRVAAKHNFKLVPLHESTEKAGSIRSFAADWFHPSTKAYKESWAPVFMDRL